MLGVSVKPGRRFTVGEWHDSGERVSSGAQSRRDVSRSVRQEARHLRDQSNNQTKWDQHDSNTRLEERMSSVQRWVERLQHTLDDTDAEINALAKTKDDAERALQAKAVPLQVATECLFLRDARRGVDLVHDPVEDELHREVKAIERAKEALTRSINDAFLQLCQLQEARQQLQGDVRDKEEALEIDSTCRALNNASATISLKPNPMRVPKGSSSPRTWDEFSRRNVERAMAEMRASSALREAITATIAQTTNELEAQKNSTDFAFRKRSHELDKVKAELEWQKKNNKQEISVLEGDIAHLEADVRAKMLPLKVAHTRLETRTYRSGVELCRDEPQYGITTEVHQIEATIATLKKKLSDSYNALTGLRCSLERVERDLASKALALGLERRCVDVRRKLTVSAERAQPLGDSFTRAIANGRIPATLVSPRGIAEKQLELV
ncbi:tektin-2-like [Petromyzon marinus]|uniref:tektin-2-like n=1 Tax=Petromyzon marinus TaxID=7757 RepID=UPI003F6FE6D7